MTNGLPGTFDPILAPELIPEFLGTPPPGGPRQDELPMPEPEVRDITVRREDEGPPDPVGPLRPPTEWPDVPFEPRLSDVEQRVKKLREERGVLEGRIAGADILTAKTKGHYWVHKPIWNELTEEYLTDVETGEYLFEWVFEKDAYDRDVTRISYITKELVLLASAGKPTPGQELTARTAAADRKAAEEALESQQAFDTVMAEYTNAIARGEISVAEADRRLRSVVAAADIESELLRAFAGQSLPAGTEFFPGFEPSGAFGTVYGELGAGEFPGLRTGGTFGVNPGALAAQIRAAGIAETALPGVDLAQQVAMAELAGLTGAGQGAVLGGDRQTATAARQVDIPLTPTQTQVRLTHPTRQAGVR
jgi:hypothetical protein